MKKRNSRRIVMNDEYWQRRKKRLMWLRWISVFLFYGFFIALLIYYHSKN